MSTPGLAFKIRARTAPGKKITAQNQSTSSNLTLASETKIRVDSYFIDFNSFLKIIYDLKKIFFARFGKSQENPKLSESEKIINRNKS